MVQRPSYQDLVHRAGQHFGIEPEYYDIWGNLHVIPVEVKKVLLEAMGVCTDTYDALETVLVSKENAEWLRMLAPVRVVTNPRLSAEGIPFHLPTEESCPGRLPRDTVIHAITLIDEHGIERDVRGDGATAVWEEERQIGGICYARCRFSLKETLECGYYRLRMTTEGCTGTSTSEMLLVICPQTAYLPDGFGQGTRYAGLQVPLFSIHSETSWGVGDFKDLGTLAEWAVNALGVDFIGLNPLHAIFNRSPLHVSPYNPLSRIFRNLIYLAVEEIPEFKESPGAQDLLARMRGQDLWKEVVCAPRVDYEKASYIKKLVLEEVFQTFLMKHWNKKGSRDSRTEHFQAYRRKKGESLQLCATFFALEEHFNAKESRTVTWGKWPEAYQDPHSSEVKAFQQQHEERILFYAFLQWHIDEQMRKASERIREVGMSMGFYLDMALGVDPWGADRWVFRDVFAQGVTVGAPPDDFSPNGQDWGIPPLITDRLKDTCYQIFIETIRENCMHASMLRLDHVMGLFRLFWIPEGARPVEGAYVKMPAEDMLGILALESHRNNVIIIGEDLGTVPPYIRTHLKAVNALSYRLFYFERNSSQELKGPSEYPAQSLVSVTTHDLPTLEGFWEGRDIMTRERLGLFPNPETHRLAWEERARDKANIMKALHSQGLLAHGIDTPPAHLTDELQVAVITYLVRTPCWLLLLNHEDIFRDKDQLNLPGTLTEYPNWTARMRYSLEALMTDPEVDRIVEKIRHIVEEV